MKRSPQEHNITRRPRLSAGMARHVALVSTILGVAACALACGFGSTREGQQEPEKVLLKTGGWVGEACDAKTPCLAGLTCAEGLCTSPQCATAPSPNDWCTQRRGEDARCVRDVAGGRCALLTDPDARVGLPCTSADACAAGQRCAAGVCAAPCAADADCLEGLRCEEGGCVTPREACSDAPDPDAFCGRLSRQHTLRCQHHLCLLDGAFTPPCDTGANRCPDGFGCVLGGPEQGQCVLLFTPTFASCDEQEDPQETCAQREGGWPAEWSCTDEGRCAEARRPPMTIWVQDETARADCDPDDPLPGLDLASVVFLDAVTMQTLGHAIVRDVHPGLGQPTSDLVSLLHGVLNPYDDALCPVSPVSNMRDNSRVRALGCGGGVELARVNSAGVQTDITSRSIVRIIEQSPQCAGSGAPEQDRYSVWYCRQSPSDPAARSFEDECFLVSGAAPIVGSYDLNLMDGTTTPLQP